MGNKKSKSETNKIEFLKDLTNDSYSFFYSENKFNIIHIDNIFFLIYSTIDKSIIIYDLINNQKISEIKKAHSQFITNLSYYFDKIKKIIYIMSVSNEDNNIKLWNLKNLDCILNLNLNSMNKIGNISFTHFLNDNNQKYIIVSYVFLSKEEDSIEVYDFEGKLIKKIDDSNHASNFIEIYYDKKSLTNYIITGNTYYSKSYNFSTNKLYHKYQEKNYLETHSVRVIEDEIIVKLIESCGDGYIRIWNFHTAILLKKINCNDFLNCSCIWNNSLLFVGCDKKAIKLVNLKDGKIIKELLGHNGYVLDLKKINHPKYGECLLSQGDEKSPIKLWVIKK